MQLLDESMERNESCFGRSLEIKRRSSSKFTDAVNPFADRKREERTQRKNWAIIHLGGELEAASFYGNDRVNNPSMLD